MKRVFLHSKKVIANHWFIICIAGTISFIIGIGLFLLLLIISMLFSKDPIDVNEVLDNFTEEELAIVLANEVDENVSDEDYLMTLARYQSHFCPRKIDKITIWMGAENTTTSYDMYYEIKRDFETIQRDRLKNSILAHINKNSVHAIRLARSHKDMIFHYTDRKSGESVEIVIDNKELMVA